MPAKESGARIVQVRDHIIGPAAPKINTVRPRKLGDYPGVSKAHLDLANKLATPLLSNPPICDELIALVQHTWTEEEASAIRHLHPLRSMSAEDIAKAEGRPVEEIRPILRRLTVDKWSIEVKGEEGKERYKLMRILGGVYEFVLINQHLDNLSDWHRRFAELFENLYETGYFLDYATKKGAGFVTYLPIGESIEANPMAIPADKLEGWLESYDLFAVGQCQCRMTMEVMEQGCGKPLSNCAVIGEGAERLVRDGIVRKVERKEFFEIKAEAEAHGLVNWMMNVENAKTQSSCSCCGCCCHNFRMVSEFAAPSMIAPPHYRPRFNDTLCTHCGKCALNCPMAALTVDVKGKSREYLAVRCIGCGLCALACEKKQAISMQAVYDYRPPFKSMSSLMTRALPSLLKTSWQVWRKYR